jgi:hypothetical protein
MKTPIFNDQDVPYFCWDRKLTAGEIRSQLRTAVGLDWVRLASWLMREAATADVWAFMTPAEVKVLKDWIQEGASFEAAGAAPTAAAPAAGAAQTWTNTAGKSLLALFARLEGDAVVVKTADGTYYTIPLANLSPESQAQAKKAGGQ